MKPRLGDHGHATIGESALVVCELLLIFNQVERVDLVNFDVMVERCRYFLLAA